MHTAPEARAGMAAEFKTAVDLNFMLFAAAFNQDDKEKLRAQTPNYGNNWTQYNIPGKTPDAISMHWKSNRHLSTWADESCSDCPH